MTKRRRERDLIEGEARRRALVEYGVPSFKCGVGGETGWPDACFLIPGGVPFIVEFKWPGERPEPKQYYVLELLEGLGYDVAWTDSVEDCLAAIAERCAARS